MKTIYFEILVNLLSIILFIIGIRYISYKKQYSFLLLLLGSYILISLIFYYIIRTHTHEEYTRYPLRTKSKIPNVIYSYWHEKPFSPLVEKCIQSWKKHNPHYTIHMITNDTISTYIPFPISRWKLATTHQQRSDCIRLYVLSEYGGIWIDASVYLSKPLDWVHSYQYYENSEMVGFHIGGNQKTPMVENWFFAAIPKSSFLQDWKKEFYRMHSYSTVQDYVNSVIPYINTDFIPGDLTYLTMHVACLFILSKKRYSLSLLSAYNGPFLLVSSVRKNYIYLPILLLLCRGTEAPLLKYRQGERKIIEGLHITSLLP